MLNNETTGYGSDSLGVQADDLPAIINQIKHGLPYSSFEALQKAVDIPQKKLAEVINVNHRTLSRRKKESKFQSDESERLLRIGRIVDRAIELMEGNIHMAKAWLGKSIPALGGKTPLEYADTEPGAHEVMTLIGRLEYGVFS